MLSFNTPRPAQIPCCTKVTTDILGLILPSYLTRLLWLTLLGPGVVEVILDGRQAAEFTLVGLLEGVPVEWEGRPSLCS